MMQKVAARPLSGMRIVVTRARSQANTLSKRLQSLGAVAIELPIIAIAAPNDFGQLDAAIRRVAEFDWVVFTSVHGVEYFLNRMSVLGIPIDRLKSRKVAAIGPATARALAEAGKTPDYVPAQFLSTRIADGMGDVNGKRVLLPRADIASEVLPRILREKGAITEEVVAYRTLLPPDLTSERVRSVFREGVDLVTFTSPSTIRNLSQVLGENELKEMLSHTKVACIGPVTAEAAKQLGLAPDLVAETHTIGALVEAIVNDRTL
jgi:uroporphyrinogen III methyltransferase/synthase